MNATTTILPRKANANRPIETFSTWHIHLQGLVQGVGFRPYVYQLAVKLQLEGAVSNGLDGVHIWLNGNRQTAEIFLQKILHTPPPLSRITGHSLAEKPHQHFNHFEIIEAPGQAPPNLWITPDLAICPSCKK
jgi:hydrogenase maturation protein HypF